jgi:aspartate-semialdehyde dehydrogenase
MLTVGIIGWRGMVGSVLMERMRAENDFQHIEPAFFSTSQAGKMELEIDQTAYPVLDAGDVATLKQMDVLLSCQGGATPGRFIRNCGMPDGGGTGLMRRRPFGWRIAVLSF